jgi:hypothetical protein
MRIGSMVYMPSEAQVFTFHHFMATMIAVPMRVIIPGSFFPVLRTGL